MKQNYLKSLFLMLMMLVGMGAWAEEVQIYLNEGATGTTNGITASGNVNTNTKNGNPGNSFANTTSSNTTFTFSGFNVSSYSDLKLVLDANFSQFPSTTNTFPSVTVKAYKNDVEVFSDATTIAVDSKTTGYNEYTINITADFDKIELTSNPSEGKTAKGAASTVYSLYMDNIKVLGTQEAGAAPVNSLTISPAAGTYETAQNVTLTAGLSGSTIYYTTDGSTPTTSSAIYSAAISVTTATTVKAIAVKEGSENVDAEASYVIKPAQPSYLLDGSSVGTSKAFRNSAEVTISAAAGCDIYYTTDGSTPTASSTAYTGAFTVTETTTLKAIAVDAYDNVSSYKTLTLTLIEGTLFSFDSSDAITAWGYTAPEASKGTDLSSPVTFTKDNINITITKGGGSTNTRFWNSNGTYDLRVYANSETSGSIVVTAPEGYNVKMINLEGKVTSLSSEGYTTSTGTWTGDAHSVTFTHTTGQNISNATIKVEATTPAPTPSTLTFKATSDNIHYYATFSCDRAIKFDEAFINDDASCAAAIKAYAVYALDGKLVLTDQYIVNNDGNYTYIPANTGILFKYTLDEGTFDGNVPFEYADDEADYLNPVTDNLLQPASVAMTAANTKYYKLAKNSEGKLGFFYGATGGAAFKMNNANGAYLAVPNIIEVKAFTLDDIETAIQNVEMNKFDTKIFNLQGQRVSNVQKGIFIMNGKKVVR